MVERIDCSLPPDVLKNGSPAELVRELDVSNRPEAETRRRAEELACLLAGMNRPLRSAGVLALLASEKSPLLPPLSSSLRERLPREDWRFLQVHARAAIRPNPGIDADRLRANILLNLGADKPRDLGFDVTGRVCAFVLEDSCTLYISENARTKAGRLRAEFDGTDLAACFLAMRAFRDLAEKDLPLEETKEGLRELAALSAQNKRCSLNAQIVLRRFETPRWKDVLKELGIAARLAKDGAETLEISPD